jgi:ribosomal protein S18 acetylase RimI-like enzyme
MPPDGPLVREAVSLDEIEMVRGLMRAYAAYLAANPGGAANISIENFERELQGLPGQYARPDGVLLLASVDGLAAGCCAIRVIQKERVPERGCEMKRLWVGQDFRGLGLGRKLIEAALTYSIETGYEAMYLDTVPAAMPEANRMYSAMGFEQVGRYNNNLVEDVVFFRKTLKN